MFGRAARRDYSPLNDGEQSRPEKRYRGPGLRLIESAVRSEPQQQARLRVDAGNEVGIGHNSGLRAPLLAPNRSLGAVISHEGGGTTYRLPSGGIRFIAFNAG